jgi:F-type H+-transporting ATPase subunit g
MQAALVQVPKVLAEFAKSRLATFIKYCKVKLMPPTPAEIPKALGQATKLVQCAITFSWTKLTTKEAWVNTFVATEVICLFFIGECIGKGSLIAYKF